MEEPLDSAKDSAFPEPGSGLARIALRPESEDLAWLIDDNFEVFSHVVRKEGSGEFEPCLKSANGARSRGLTTKDSEVGVASGGVR